MGNIELDRRRTGHRENAQLPRDLTPGRAPARNRRNTMPDPRLALDMTTGATPPGPAAMAYFDGLLATDLIETTDLTIDPGVLDRGGWWAVLITFEGAMTGYRFRTVTRTSLPPPDQASIRKPTFILTW